MIDDAIVRYVHFVGIMILASTTITQVFILDRNVRSEKIRQYILLDRINLLGAVLAMGAGFVLWFYVGKPGEFYSGNFLMYVKLLVFFAVGAISSIPRGFIRRSPYQSNASISVPENIIRIKRLEIAGLVLLPLFAVFVAQGLGS